MTHRFPIKEVALQAGLSTATIDRALNDRAHVSPQTKRRVEAAIAELEGQEEQLSARGRRMFIDIVVEAPARFSAQIRDACEAVLPTFGPAIFRPRFHFYEMISEADLAALLRRIAKRGSQGVCLKARDVAKVRDAMGVLSERGIPVVTMFTDIADAPRVAYAGLDNLSAGQTAAYLMLKSLNTQHGTILTTKSQSSFAGEEQRFIGFSQIMKHEAPNIKLIDASGGGGLSRHTANEVARVAKDHSKILGVYSMGGGNEAIIDILSQNGHEISIFIAHDLDEENTVLLQKQAISYVLHHDLKQDFRHAFLSISKFHKLVRFNKDNGIADVQIITPMNMPRDE